ncbi:Beta-hexosaminidase [Drechslerella dactyloides]|uniref:Beta-hexosaminidase n=1 Tax=Drechslerella dactyloides TaxID=74499 RepID=A0AAD6J0U8_DREDA|nr:Beta-hexosaminidase [Drechslerella dactyloides]
MGDNEQIDWYIGSVFMMGFSGTAVNPQVKQLIEQYHVGTIMLSAKNFKSAEQATKLILELQMIARNAGHRHPLLIAIDQENGGLNNLCDPLHIRQFPGAMGMTATGSTKLCREVAKATALEVSSVGVNWVLGPVLDVLNITSRNQPLGVRTMGHDPQEVSEMGVAFLQGLQGGTELPSAESVSREELAWLTGLLHVDGGVATCGKHFPSYGNIEFHGSPLDVPMLPDTIDQLKLHGLIPFRKAVSANIDAIMVGGCSMPSLGTKVMHACLSDAVINKLLREEMGFKGVVVSECLEMEALHENIGVGQATVMALGAGCDQIIVCRSFTLQLEAMQGLRTAVDSAIIPSEMVAAAAARVVAMKEKRTSWQKALNPPGVNYLSIMEPTHKELSLKAYEASITVVRDEKRLIPLTNSSGPDDEILLLTPLVKPLPASLLAQAQALASVTKADQRSEHSPTPSSTPRPDAKSLLARFRSDKDRVLMTGESVFRELGRSLARNTGTRILHTSYTANGIRPVHENLIERASSIIIVTADANQNRYQYGFTKHISAVSKIPTDGFPKGKNVMVIAVSSPYDFWMDKSINTYVCTYDFTETAMDALVKVLFGKKPAKGSLPGTVFKNAKQQPKQQWLVEHWRKSRDLMSLQELIGVIRRAGIEHPHQYLELATLAASSYLFDDIVMNDGSVILEQQNFVVRNSSTRALYGFCSTYFNPRDGRGSIGAVLVDPSRQNLSIGTSLHAAAMRFLRQKKGIHQISVGSRFPAIYLGIPVTPVPSINMLGLDSSDMSKSFKPWFRSLGWPDKSRTTLYRLAINNLAAWQPPTAISDRLSESKISFELISKHSTANPHPYFDKVMEHVRKHDNGKYLDAYRIAADDLQLEQARILAAKNEQQQILGSLILIWATNDVGKLEKYVPLIRDRSDPDEAGTGGIVYPVLAPTQLRLLALEGLVALATKHFQMPNVGGPGFDRVVLDCLDNFEEAQNIVSSGGGWKFWHTFEELECSPSEMKAS